MRRVRSSHQAHETDPAQLDARQDIAGSCLDSDHGSGYRGRVPFRSLWEPSAGNGSGDGSDSAAPGMRRKEHREQLW